MKAALRNYRVWDTEIKGFHVRVTPAGRITHRFFNRLDGIQREVFIGQASNVTAEQARILAKEIAGQVAQRIDTGKHRKIGKETRKSRRSQYSGPSLSRSINPGCRVICEAGKNPFEPLGYEGKEIKVAEGEPITVRNAKNEKIKVCLTGY